MGDRRGSASRRSSAPALKPGHDVDVLPCTRVCSYDTSEGFQPFLENAPSRRSRGAADLL